MTSHKKNPHIMFCVLLKLSFVAVIVTSQECGVVKYTSELIYGGQTSKKGAWPWLVALHDINTEEFFCGSTLVSDKHVLTGKNFFLEFKFISSGFTFEICVKLIFSLLQPRIASGAKEHPNKVTTRRTPSSSQANMIFAISKRTRSEEISLRSHFILTGNRTQPTSMLTLRSRRPSMRCISPMQCSRSACRTLMLC